MFSNDKFGWLSMYLSNTIYLSCYHSGTIKSVRQKKDKLVWVKLVYTFKFHPSDDENQSRLTSSRALYTETSRVWRRQGLRTRKPVEFDTAKGFVHGNQSSLMPSRASYTETSRVWCRQRLRSRNLSSLMPSTASYTNIMTQASFALVWLVVVPHYIQLSGQLTFCLPWITTLVTSYLAIKYTWPLWRWWSRLSRLYNFHHSTR